MALAALHRVVAVFSLWLAAVLRSYYQLFRRGERVQGQITAVTQRLMFWWGWTVAYQYEFRGQQYRCEANLVTLPTLAHGTGRNRGRLPGKTRGRSD